jgi:hypothetical protein
MEEEDRSKVLELIQGKGPIVKVFIIEDSKEGAWLDCGTGSVEIVRKKSYSPSQTLDPHDLDLRVINTTNETWPKDDIDPERERRLRGGSSDEMKYLDVNLGEASEFLRSQSSIC